MWQSLNEWFGVVNERKTLVSDFNQGARNSFVSGQAPTLLEARVSVGTSEFKHAFSKFLAGGFRIKAMSGKALKKNEIMEIGNTILKNKELVRRLIALGWDTLEVHDVKGSNGYKWALEKFTNM